MGRFEACAAIADHQATGAASNSRLAPGNFPEKHMTASGQTAFRSSRAGSWAWCRAGTEDLPSFGPPIVDATCLNIASNFGNCCGWMPALIAPPAANDQTHRFASAWVLGTNM